MNNICRKILILISLFIINNPWPDFLTFYWPFEKESIKIQRKREKKRNKDYDKKRKENNYLFSEMVKNNTDYYINNDIDENSISTNFSDKEELIKKLKLAKKNNALNSINVFASDLSTKHNIELMFKRDQGLSKSEKDKEIKEIEKELAQKE
jgi:superfamily II DNA or RNA helicase